MSLYRDSHCSSNKDHCRLIDEDHQRSPDRSYNSHSRYDNWSQRNDNRSTANNHRKSAQKCHRKSTSRYSTQTIVIDYIKNIT